MRSRPFLLAAISLLLAFGRESAGAQEMSALLDTLQHTAFRFFWDEANPATGLIKDRSAAGVPSSIASVGFGLTAIGIGADHGWVSRAAARDRVHTTLRTLWTAPQGAAASGTAGYRGLFFHFLDLATAHRAWSSELSTIDTGLLLAGIVYAREYFDGPDSIETAIRSLADSLYYRMDWKFMNNFNPGLLMGWNPGTQFAGYTEWTGYNEAMIMYILAIGSPTRPADPAGWTQRWTAYYRLENHYGQTYVAFAPLFGHQYSHCWIDFRGMRDAYMRNAGFDYFENSRRATYAARAYCADNPGGFAGYSDSLWGLTACDGPNGYKARGGPPAENDDGTIAPTAAISSLPFAPDIVQPFIRNLWNSYRTQLWGPYGFRDAFNLQAGWFGPDVIGIDQGPIILMIENYRTGRVWERFMRNADVQRGLQRAGFQAVTSVETDRTRPRSVALHQNYPNPFNPQTTIRFDLPAAGHVRLALYDLLGREVALLADGERAPGPHAVRVDGSSLASGPYVYRLLWDRGSLSRTLILLK
jgi:hypothetical protein